MRTEITLIQRRVQLRESFGLAEPTLIREVEIEKGNEFDFSLIICPYPLSNHYDYNGLCVPANVMKMV